MRWILSIVAALVSLQVWAQDCLPTVKELPFQAGESFRMGLYFKWGAVNTEVATADVSLDATLFNGEPALHTTLTAFTASFFSSFYHMNEHFESWFSPENLLPLKYTRNTEQGDYRAYNHYIYDWDSRMIHADINFGNHGPQALEIPLKDCVFDLTAILYYLRSLDMNAFSPGQKAHMSFAIDDAVFDVVLTYKGKERVKVRRVGKVDALRFSCTVVSGALFDGNTEMSIWFSDDENRLPIGLMAPLRIGSVQGWIKNYYGLKYPFSSRH
ncbi:MAG: DUF3108 domain-containing protein [Bacteroidales bacterium]|nr:DUF3108 domain-containing protein [Bacteroidales bacterium]